MHSADVLQLFQQALTLTVPSSPPVPEKENTSPKRATMGLDSDDETGPGGQLVGPNKDLLKQLHFFFPDALVLAALDIVVGMVVGESVLDSEGWNADVKVKVIRYTSPLQRVQHQVVGTKRKVTTTMERPRLPQRRGEES